MDNRQEGKPDPILRSAVLRTRALAAHCVIIWVVLASLPVVIAPGVAAQSALPALSSIRVVAVVPFTDEVGMSADLAHWASARLAVLLSGVGVQVVPTSQVEQALQETGLRPADLVSLAASDNLAHRIQADAVITGRLIEIEREGGRMGDPMDRGPVESHVTLALRLLLAPTRRVSYVTAIGSAAGHTGGFYRAADQALRDLVSSWQRYNSNGKSDRAPQSARSNHSLR